MGSQDHSFDIVSQVDLQEVDNAVQQVKKEVAQRFDFKGSISSVDLEKSAKTITIKTENEFRLKTLIDMLQTRAAKRAVSLKSLEYGAVETGMVGGSVKQVITIRQGLTTDQAREIAKAVKEMKLKVQASIQSDQVRVQGIKIDDLQAVIAALRRRDFGADLQTINFR